MTIPSAHHAGHRGDESLRRRFVGPGGSNRLLDDVRLAFRDVEPLSFTSEQGFNHPPFFRVGFPGKQIFEVGNISSSNEPIHHDPSMPAKITGPI